MSPPRSLLLTLLSTLLLISTSLMAATAGRPVQFPSLDTRDDTAIELNGIFYTANSDGVRPLIIALHGCGGLYSARKGHEADVHPRHQAMAELLQARGYHVLLVDSFTARGVRSICTTLYKTRDITPDNRRLDAIGAMLWATQQKEVDPHRVVLLGWSNGGSSTLNTLNQKHQDKLNIALPAFKAGVAFYPGCSAYLKKSYQLNSPLLILVGELDDWTPPAACQSLQRKLSPAPLSVSIYPDSYHDFDAPDQPIRLRKDIPNGAHPGMGVTTGSNPVAKEAAYQAMSDFLEKNLK